LAAATELAEAVRADHILYSSMLVVWIKFMIPSVFLAKSGLRIPGSRHSVDLTEFVMAELRKSRGSRSRDTAPRAVTAKLDPVA
jgi:hypothetical protein